VDEAPGIRRDADYVLQVGQQLVTAFALVRSDGWYIKRQEWPGVYGAPVQVWITNGAEELTGPAEACELVLALVNRLPLIIYALDQIAKFTRASNGTVPGPLRVVLPDGPGATPEGGD